MPGKTTGPSTAVKLHKGEKLRMLSNVNKGGRRAIPEKMTVLINTPTETARNILLFGFSK